MIPGSDWLNPTGMGLRPANRASSVTGLGLAMSAQRLLGGRRVVVRGGVFDEMRIEGDQRAHQAQLDQRGRLVVGALDLEEVHLHLLLRQDPRREIRRDADAALGLAGVRRRHHVHALHAELLEEDPAEEAGIAVVDQHPRPRVGRIGLAPKGEAHRVHENGRDHEQPDVGGPVPQEQPQVVVADGEDGSHQRAPFSSRRRNSRADAAIRIRPSTPSFSTAPSHAGSAPPNCRPRAARTNHPVGMRGVT